jgi:hypothetical protein
MQQRRLRLGDILDDYCPRERRITNHVVVAMIEDDVRQTRCSTCDAEHEYKQAKPPAPRRKKAGALSQEGVEDARPRAVTAAHVPSEQDTIPDESPNDDIDTVSTPVNTEAAILAADTSVDADPDAGEGDRGEDDGPVHRRLIRATLPRPEGHVPERKEPEFTMRQQPGRDGNSNRHGQRSRQYRETRNANGQQGGHNRFGGGQRHGAGASRQGSGAPHGQGQRQGNRPGQPSSHRDSGRPAGQNRGPGRKRGR